MKKGLLKHGFQAMAPWRLKKSVHPQFPWRHCRRQISGTLLSSTMSDWGCIPHFPTKLPSSAVARCGFVHKNSLKVHTWLCCTTFFSWSPRILEEHVSRKMERMLWTNSNGACSSLRFLSLGTSEVCCYATDDSDVQDWHKWIQNKFEMMPMTTGVFQWVMQWIFIWAMHCIEVEGGHFEHLQLSRGRNPETMLQKAFFFFLSILV